jgi:hypothetical protein
MSGSSSDDTLVEWVSEDIIRQIFNENRIYELVKNGVLRTYLKRNSHPANSMAVGEPYCTWSQIVLYYDQDNHPVAIVHQYLRPDGTIGASGLPDPKRIFLGRRIISVRSGIGKK